MAKNDLQNFKKMLKGRTDIFFCNETAANGIFSANPELKGKFKFAEKPLKEIEFHMSISKKSPAVSLLPKINSAIADMKKDGTVASILGK